MTLIGQRSSNVNNEVTIWRTEHWTLQLFSLTIFSFFLSLWKNCEGTILTRYSNYIFSVVWNSQAALKVPTKVLRILCAFDGMNRANILHHFCNVFHLSNGSSERKKIWRGLALLLYPSSFHFCNLGSFFLSSCIQDCYPFADNANVICYSHYQWRNVEKDQSFRSIISFPVHWQPTVPFNSSVKTDVIIVRSEIVDLHMLCLYRWLVLVQ